MALGGKSLLEEIPTSYVGVPLHRVARDPRHLLGIETAQATVLPTECYGPQDECE
jgi:hypothetical protein